MSSEETGPIGAATALASKASLYGGAATSMVGTLSSNEVVGAVGLILALAGFIVNLYFGLRNDRRRQAEHEVTMRRLLKGRDCEQG